jgi:outer membrane protein assembly factor BamE (lipoprotein component of BamABCDE complex)
MKITCLCLFIALCTLLSGCATPQSRIEANPEQFAAYPPEAQSAIRSGSVQLGFSPDMVEMALGKPHYTFLRTGEDHPNRIIWQYVQIIRDVHTQPLYASGSYRGSGSAWVDTVDQREIPVLRIEFENNNVVAIEKRS